MKNILLSLLFLFTLTATLSSYTKAQTVELLAGNSLNGAMNGVLLGGATMAVTNSDDFYPLQVGLGLGTLYGIGMGAHDIVQGGGKEILVSGLFNDGSNSSIIVLLDTFYGAAAGSIIVTSIMLVANEPLIDGLQYGAGIGAWIGFGFGVFDTFFLASRTSSTMASVYQPTNNASGLLGMDFDTGTSLGFMNPTLFSSIELNQTTFSKSINPGVELLNVRVNF
ncbi:MAG: hypothetical protein JJ971_07055 [Balneolaceae bacterium]|nr:hypothetical protein [Balneolaceae bacterium]MBO6547010.1 hypothetical protein [Balneolaceae bacterium]MBO6649370.1 hypothetical protein [Balneolaceae bacterium]